jgi:hypothetical protein
MWLIVLVHVAFFMVIYSLMLGLVDGDDAPGCYVMMLVIFMP